MNKTKVVMGLVGSPNREGRTNQLVTAALEGAAQTGARVEKVQMSEQVVEACRDCLPWVCQENLKCSFADNHFDSLSRKVLDCGSLILGTPVYWWDTSAMVKYFILKMFRVYARSAPLNGLPALGIGIAGGTGNGLISGLRPIYHFFQVMQMRALEPLPVTRFDFQEALHRAEELGRQMAGLTQERRLFGQYEERLLWYDRLPYLGSDRAGERRLLAALTVAAVGPKNKPEMADSLARADILTAAGRTLEAMTETSKAYEACVKILDGK
jgi:multimeric flavodoxin WrbA